MLFENDSIACFQLSVKDTRWWTHTYVLSLCVLSQGEVLWTLVLHAWCIGWPAGCGCCCWTSCVRWSACSRWSSCRPCRRTCCSTITWWPTISRIPRSSRQPCNLSAIIAQEFYIHICTMTLFASSIDELISFWAFSTVSLVQKVWLRACAVKAIPDQWAAA